MNKKFILFVRQRFPQLFSKVVKSLLLARIVTSLGYFHYLFCCLTQKPYFGVFLLAGQTWENRKFYMRKILEGEIKRGGRKEFRLLEIGSWVGDSAVLWAETMKFDGQEGTIVCVDPWEPYSQSFKNEKSNVAPIIMNDALKKGNVYSLFLHNIKAAGVNHLIIPIKGSSRKVLNMLQDQTFDMIYIDGDHSYSGIMHDLQKAQQLLVDGGIVCGDDLDLLAGDIDYQFALEHKESNIIEDPKTKRAVHPGVCIAVSEFFSEPISNYNGFWAMRKKGSQWENVEIKYRAHS